MKTNKKEYVYLLTRKFNGEVIKSLYHDFNTALDEFNTSYRSNEQNGFACAVQTTVDERGQYTKVSKCMNGTNVIRMRLESIYFCD